jgi:SAM-dependent methyltransferase
MIDARLDALLQPYTDVLLDHADLHPGQSVVDVGCGSGAVTRTVAQVCGPGVVGIDVSESGIRVARQRAPGLAFVHADATVWRPSGPVNGVVSRFGVMFFEHPVDAFRHIHSWLRPGGTFTALVWRGAELNGWIGEPFGIVARHLGRAAPPQGAPGPNSMADPDRIRVLLADFADVSLTPVQVTTRVSGDADALLAFYTQWCPVARLFADAPPPVVDAIHRDLADLVARRNDGAGIDLIGHIWVIQARA